MGAVGGVYGFCEVFTVNGFCQKTRRKTNYRKYSILVLLFNKINNLI